MIITCPECRTRFRLADERVGPAGLRVRCAVCRTVFTAAQPHPGPVADLPETAEEAGIGAPAAAADWLAEEEPTTAAPPPEALAVDEPAESDQAAELAETPAETVVAEAVEAVEAAEAVEESAPSLSAGELLPPLAEKRSRPWGAILLLLLVAALVAFAALTADGRALWTRLRGVLGAVATSPADTVQIGLEVVGSSYLQHPEAGQLLIIRGSAANRSGETRSSLAVKGVLLDGDGKAIQQQSVFCGNPLSDSELLAMSFVQIEEAMSNQFGAGLGNLNVPPGGMLPFTIVFRNIPATMANISVEAADSRPGGS